MSFAKNFPRVLSVEMIERVANPINKRARQHKFIRFASLEGIYKDMEWSQDLTWALVWSDFWRDFFEHDWVC